MRGIKKATIKGIKEIRELMKMAKSDPEWLIASLVGFIFVFSVAFLPTLLGLGLGIMVAIWVGNPGPAVLGAVVGLLPNLKWRRWLDSYACSLADILFLQEAWDPDVCMGTYSPTGPLAQERKKP